MNYLGDFVEDDVVYLMFNTFTSDDPSASCTITNFANTDVHIHKDDNTTQRNNAAGITVSTNFDGITGSHLIKIDTNDNTVGGFWVTGHDYFVRIEGTTVDGATLNIVVGHFSIQNRFMRGTDSAALAATALTDVTWTDAKAGHIDAPISTVDTVVDGIQTDLSNVTDGLGALKALLDTISGYTDKIDDATNGLTAIKAEVEGLAGAAMRGTDSANTTVPDAAGIAPTAVEIRTEMDTNSTKMAPSQTLNDYKATGFSTHDAAAVKTAIEAAGSSLALILADTGTSIPADIAALNDITVADIIAGISDGTLDLQEMMRIILSATAGKSSGGGTVTLVFRDAADSKARITATVDANGNRTAMTLDGA